MHVPANEEADNYLARKVSVIVLCIGAGSRLACFSSRLIPAL
jgi:hypothetical protein